MYVGFWSLENNIIFKPHTHMAPIINIFLNKLFSCVGKVCAEFAQDFLIQLVQALVCVCGFSIASVEFPLKIINCICCAWLPGCVPQVASRLWQRRQCKEYTSRHQSRTKDEHKQTHTTELEEGHLLSTVRCMIFSSWRKTHQALNKHAQRHCFDIELVQHAPSTQQTS